MGVCTSKTAQGGKKGMQPPFDEVSSSALRKLESKGREVADLTKDLVAACASGDCEKVDLILQAQPSLREVSLIKCKDQGKLELGDPTTLFRTYDTSEWNPILLAVAQGHLAVVKYCFE